ncbi:hypothetical protein LSH36_373g02019, partial [Paralvinella palmiformis]
TYSCHNGYQIEGEANSFSRQLYCQADAEWSTSIPNCIPLDCGTPSTPSYLTVVSQNGSGYQDSIEVECAPGYDYVSGNLTRTCQADGKWNGQTPVCIQGTTRQVAGFLYRDTVNYTCKPGFQVDSGTVWSEITCQANQTWTGQYPSCKRIACPDPGLGEHATRVVGGLLFEDIIEYTCDEDYRVDSGIYKIECIETKTWSYPLPECVRK